VRQLYDYYYLLHPDIKRPTSGSDPSSGPADAPADVNAPSEDDSSVENADTNATCKYYTCRKCRTRIFDETELMPHDVGQHEFSYRRRDNAGNHDCNMFFIGEQKDWMGDLIGIEGKLICPKCTSRVGSWKWDGLQCSCGFVFVLYQLSFSLVAHQQHVGNIRINWPGSM
jgi:dual specificity phosphatase 12